MATKKVTQLTATTTLTSTDLAMVVTDVSTVPASKKITIANLLKYLFTGSTQLTVGTITDGEFLKRSGTTIISGTGGGTVTTTGSPTNGDITKFSGATSITNAAVTGSGSVVLATSPSLTTPVLGTPSSGTLSSCTVDGTNGVGYINIPQNSQSANYTTVAADAGKHIFHPSTDANTRTFTIDSNANVPYLTGTAISFINLTSQAVTIAITSDTLYLAGTGSTGSRTLAQYGVATAVKIDSTHWIISGTGLT